MPNGGTWLGNGTSKLESGQKYFQSSKQEEIYPILNCIDQYKITHSKTSKHPFSSNHRTE